MTTMLEKMARAMCAADGHDPNGPTCDIYFHDDPDAGKPWASYRAGLRAALLAIREPSNAMHNAGAFSEHQSQPPKIVVGEEGALSVEWRPANPSGLFTAMIDAILNEPDRPT